MVSDSMKNFGALCRQVTAEPALTIKQEIIRGFLTRFDGDTGLLLKLLLPKYAQRVYYIQDKQLMRVLSLVLRVDEDDLKDKLNANGCIAETACAYFRPTATLDADGWCAMDMTEFDAFLTAMAAATVETERVPLLKRFFSVACRNVVYYFFREVKQDLRLGAGLRVVLNGLHPTAYDIFKNCANVQEVVRRVKAGPAAAGVSPSPAPQTFSANEDSNSTAAAAAAAPGDVDDEDGKGEEEEEDDGLVGEVNTAISIGIPLAPMLAAPARSIDQVLAKCPNGAFSEVKYDGERIQIHKRGNKLTFFARSLRPMRDDKYAGLEPFILQAIKATDCVLDGEILMVDVRTSVPLPFGTLGKHRRTQFSSACPCVFLFDILLCDDRSLLRVPMEKRREKLKKNVHFIRNRVMFSELCLIEGRPEQRRALLQQHLQRAIAEGLEGLVIKDKKSVYEPRARHWLKIKKDYLDGLADSADLLVLGAWYGSGNKGGQLSTFLMGCVDPTLPPGTAGRFKTVCKVGNGLKDNEISAISVAYSKRMVSTTTARDGQRGAPAWLDCQSAHLPDMVLRDPESADVMEIIGAELSGTKSHTSGISIRFPRILKMRTDKTVDTATNLRELQQLFRTSKEKLSLAGVDASLHLADSYTVRPDEEDNSLSVPPDGAPASRAAAPSLPAPRSPQPQQHGASPASSAEHSRRTAPASVTYVAKGDATTPSVPPTEPIVIFHSVAVQGRWSARGVMRRISEVYGPTAGKTYDQAAASSGLGHVLYAEVGPVSRPGRVFVASAVAQRTAAAGQVPLVDQRALEKALTHAAAYAQRNGASLHVVVPSAETKVEVAPLLELAENLCAQRDVPFYIYGLPPNAIPKQPVSDAKARRPPTPPAPLTSAFVSRVVAEDSAEDTMSLPLPSTPAPAAAPLRSGDAGLAGGSFGEDVPQHFARGRGRRVALLHGVVAQVVYDATAPGAAAEAAKIRTLLEFMQGRCAAVSTSYAASTPCTHVVMVGDAAAPHLAADQRHNVFAVSAEWVRECFNDGVRYSECVYRLDSTRPTALLLAGQCLFFTARLLNVEGSRWRRLARLLGATVHDSWRMIGQRTSFALTDVWDDECAEVYRLGGWVLHCQWLEDCAMAAAVLPLDAYIFSPSSGDAQQPRDAVDGSAGGPLSGKTVCIFTPNAVELDDVGSLCALCRDSLGASLVSEVAEADVVVLASAEAAVRQSAVAAGAAMEKLAGVEWMRRCADAQTFVPPFFKSDAGVTSEVSGEASPVVQTGNEVATPAAVAAEEPLSETSSTVVYSSDDDS